MKRYTDEELKEKAQLHRKWRLGEPGGVRLDLRGAYLSGADLSGAYLSGADLSGADLRGANLRGADLRGANLREADLRGANLREADLSEADLRGAEKLPHHQICPEEGAFIAYKKAGNHVLTLLIPEDAQRVSSLIGRKCRTDKAQVLKAETVEGGATDQIEFRSRHDYTFVYRVGETVECPDFDGDIRVECTRGIHFWMSKREAREW